jgi:hypothetical protein
MVKSSNDNEKKATTTSATTASVEAPPAIRLYDAEDFPQNAKPPNTIRITVVRSRNIAMATLRATTSLYCKLTCGGIQYKTKVKQKTLDPIWNEVQKKNYIYTVYRCIRILFFILFLY